MEYALLILSWTIVVIQSNLPLYILEAKFLIRIQRFILPLFTLTVLSYLLLYGLDLPIVLPIVFYIILKIFFSYGVNRGNFSDDLDIERYIEDPECVAVFLPTGVDTVPILYLRSADMILERDGLQYSLSYCLLCNTIHAYELPTIGGVPLEISSHGGSVINGNKVLHDNSGRYIWQQFTGKPISAAANGITLKEIETKRVLVHHLKSTYPDARFYSGRRLGPNHFIYSAIGRLVRNISNLRISKDRIDDRLPAKLPIAGVTILGDGTKAYPMTLFPPNEVTLIQDSVSGVNLTIVSDGTSVYAFSRNGLSYSKGLLHSGEESWNIDGRAVNAEESLPQLMLTSSAYWYMWVKFNPDTEVYHSSSL